MCLFYTSLLVYVGLFWLDLSHTSNSGQITRKDVSFIRSFYTCRSLLYVSFRIHRSLLTWLSHIARGDQLIKSKDVSCIILSFCTCRSLLYVSFGICRSLLTWLSHISGGGQMIPTARRVAYSALVILESQKWPIYTKKDVSKETTVLYLSSD